MHIAGASRGWRRREHYQGGIGRRPLSRPSSAFVLLGRPTPGLGRVRGAREVDVFSVALFSRPRGMDRPASELRPQFQSGRVVGEGLGPGVPEKREIVDSVVDARGHIW